MHTNRTLKLAKKPKLLHNCVEIIKHLYRCFSCKQMAIEHVLHSSAVTAILKHKVLYREW